jgi:hypothetical protein
VSSMGSISQNLQMYSQVVEDGMCIREAKKYQNHKNQHKKHTAPGCLPCSYFSMLSGDSPSLSSTPGMLGHLKMHRAAQSMNQNTLKFPLIIYDYLVHLLATEIAISLPPTLDCIFFKQIQNSTLHIYPQT